MSVLRIVFFGTPEFAVPSLLALVQSPHQVVGVVSQPDRPKGRGQQIQVTPTRAAADRFGIPVLQPGKIRDETFLQQVRDLRPDLGVVVAFGRLLPDALLAIPRLGMINVHGSILPRYRGAAPIQRAVLAGETETGVTIMRVVTEMDAGPTFAVAAVPIPADATSADMAGTLSHLGAARLLPVVDDLAMGRAVETPQDHALATHAAKITKAESAIDWRVPALVVHDKVRGLQPWPLASTRLAGERLVLRRTAVDPGDPGVRSVFGANHGVRSAFAANPGVRSVFGANREVRSVTPPASRTNLPADTDLTPPLAANADLTPPVAANTDLTPSPGTVVRAEGDELIVACGEGTALRVLEIQPEGRRAMTAREFMAGRGVKAGARFEP